MFGEVLLGRVLHPLTKRELSHNHLYSIPFIAFLALSSVGCSDESADRMNSSLRKSLSFIHYSLTINKLTSVYFLFLVLPVLLVNPLLLVPVLFCGGTSLLVCPILPVLPLVIAINCSLLSWLDDCFVQPTSVKLCFV